MNKNKELERFKVKLMKLINLHDLDTILKAPDYAISEYVISKIKEFGIVHDEQRKNDT